MGGKGGRGASHGGLRGILFVLVVAGFFWWLLRGTEMGSRSVLFAGRDLEPVAGAVAFAVTDDTGRSALQVVDAAGGEPLVLAEDVHLPSAPSWSPDHTRVAYHTRVAPGTESGLVLRTVARTGGEPAQLAAANDDARSDQNPVWSPDGTHLAFLSASRDGVPIMSVHVLSSAGGPARRIGPEPQEHQMCFVALNDETKCWAQPTGDAEEVAWLPSGELVYRRTVLQDGNPAAPDEGSPAAHALYRVGLDGAPPQLLAEIEHPADQLVPSPDGRFVLYGQSGGTTHVLELAGGQRWEIGRNVGDPSWSPDGRRLLFVQRTAVYTTAFDGSDRVNLTHTHVGDAHGMFATPVSAVWSPDGRHIAFTERRGGGGPVRLQVANADGTGWTEIVRSDSGSRSDITHLHWLPDAGLP